MGLASEKGFVSEFPAVRIDLSETLNTSQRDQIKTTKLQARNK